MGTIDFVEIARQGLHANRKAMNTTSQNIANVNTPGFSRQRVNMVASAPVLDQMGRRAGGGGVDISKVVRMQDQFVQKRIEDQSLLLGEYKTRSVSMKQVEDIVAGGEKTFAINFTAFLIVFRELSANPELPTQRFAVQEAAKDLGHSFRTSVGRLEDMRDNVDLQIDGAVGRVNMMARDLARLNILISGYSQRGGAPGELLDQQDLLVKNITEKMKLQVERDQFGQVNLLIPGAGSLVQAGECSELAVGRYSGGEAQKAPEVRVHIRDFATQKFSTLPTDCAGEIGGLIHTRNEFIAPTIRQLDAVAFTMANKINEIHSKGISMDGRTSGKMFSLPDRVEGAATYLTVDPSVEKSIDSIAAGFDPELVADNRIALELSQLQETKLMPELSSQGMGEGDNHYTLGETVNSIVTRVGAGAQSETQNYEHQQAMMAQLETQRESISGVSLEEEAVNLVQYQTAFNAAAKTMRVGDEMLETILNIVD